MAVRQNRMAATNSEGLVWTTADDRAIEELSVPYFLVFPFFFILLITAHSRNRFLHEGKCQKYSTHG